MTFGPVETDRLTIRRPEIGDAAALHERRNDPDTARYQSWTIPYSMEAARKTATGAATMDGPTEDEWWMATIVERRSGTIIGDVAIHLSFLGRVAEIGYTLRPSHWGLGYATEAVGAVVDTLIGQGVLRLSASTHPDNLASIRLLERLGFEYEGRTIESYHLDEGAETAVSDETLFGMTAAGRARWLARPSGRPETVRLIEIDETSHRAVADLETHYSQRSMVAPVAASFGNALFPPVIDGVRVRPWLRAIEIDGDGNGPTMAGFVMLAEMTGTRQEPYLWRLLIDRWHQRRGIASVALDQVEGWLRDQGHETVRVHWVPGPGSAEPFYLGRGYTKTGRIEDGEVEGRTRLG